MERIVAQQGHDRRGTATEGAHWAAFVGAPVIWVAYLNGAYALVPFACAHGAAWAIWVWTLAAAAGSAACGLVGLERARRRETGDVQRDERVRFMNLGGVAASTLFTALILVQGLASFVFSPCEGWAVHW